MPPRSSAARSSRSAQDEPVPPSSKTAQLLSRLKVRDRSAVVRQDSGFVKALRQFGRRAAVVLGICASLAEAVPVLGAPVKGALEAAIKVQVILEVSKMSILILYQVFFVVFNAPVLPERPPEHRGNPATCRTSAMLRATTQSQPNVQRCSRINRVRHFAHMYALRL